MALITIIGRGHSGTRAMSHTLYASGVYMGSSINLSGDKIPPHDLYEACRVFAKYVTWQGGLSWDFSTVLRMAPDPAFIKLVETYLADVLSRTDEHKGWKLPETTLIYPWILRMFPDAKYIQWFRDPRDCVMDSHKTDDLRDFGVEYPQTDDLRRRRAISWIYQYHLMQATPRPQHTISVRFEDFVLKQCATLRRLEKFLGFSLGRIIVRPDAAYRWKKQPEGYDFDFFAEPIRKMRYEK
ncbi:MAG: sulfotransferase [candidate division Zixibacteria bacterium]|nr:sulfotransferase [candidate division Zixibacteria bacterium]